MVFDKLKQLGEIRKMRDQVMKIQRALAEETVEIEEQGIKVIMSGDQKIREVWIEGQEQVRLVEVLNKAIRRSQEVAAQKLEDFSGGLRELLGK